MAKTIDNTPIDDLVAFIEDKSKTCKKKKNYQKTGPGNKYTAGFYN